VLARPRPYSLFSLACAFMLCLPCAAGAQVPEPDSILVHEDLEQSEPDVALGAGLAVGVWADRAIAESEWGFSIDDGRSWSAPLTFPVLPFDQTGIRARVCGDQTGNFYASLLYDNSGGIACYRMHMNGSSMEITGPTFPAPVLGGSPYDSPRIACDPSGAVIYVSYTHVIPLGLTAMASIEIVRSRDGGVTWSPPIQLGGSSSNGSSIAVGPDGGVAVSWEDFATRTVQVATSRDSGATFSAPVAAALILDDLGSRPPGWADVSGRYAPGYVEGEIDADFPNLAIDTSTGPYRGAMYLTWSDYRDGASGPFTGSMDEGEPNDFFAEARLVQVGQDVNGISYSYEFAGGDDCDYFYFDGIAGEMVEIHGAVNGTSPTAPASWSASISLYCGADTSSSLTRIAYKTIKQPGTGITPVVIATLPRTGRYYLFTGCSDYYSYSYTMSLREWVPSGLGVSRDSRDVVLVRSTDGGQTWSPKVRVNDSPAGVDDCLPRLVVDGTGRVHVAWYDRRDDPGCGSIAKVYWTHSENGGSSFAPSVALSSVGTNWVSFGGLIENIGDYLGLATTGDGIYVAWVDGRGPDPDLYRAIITDLATQSFSARVSCRMEGPAVLVDYRLFAGLPAGAIGIERTGDGQIIEIATGRSTAEGTYQASDSNVEPGRHYTYTVWLVSTPGPRQALGSTEIDVPGVVTHLDLSPPRPNPSSAEVRLTLALPRDADTRVSLYDITGHRVRTLANGHMTAGTSELMWDGRDDAGHVAPSGVYFVRARAGREQINRQVLRMR
jgi:flagellar hook capping protein FlgD/BNR/Asp-box repeat protein